MSRSCLAAPALVVAALAGAGCGGSEESGSLTRSALIARADLICRRLHTRLASTTISRPGDYARLLPPLAAYERAAAAELRKLAPPASMAGDWRQFVHGLQAFADGTARLGADATSNGLKPTTSTRTASATATSGTRQMGAIAGRDGFKDCRTF